MSAGNESDPYYFYAFWLYEFIQIHCVYLVDYVHAGIWTTSKTKGNKKLIQLLSSTNESLFFAHIIHL